MIQALLVTICLAVFPYQGSSIILESGNVNDYEVVYPQKVPVLPKGFQNPEQETKYEDTMQYEFQVNGEPVVLHLERNKGLFSKDYSETHYSPDGREITTSPPVQDHCYYHGYIQNDADSTAVISACDGLKGHFKHQGETYLIEPLKLSNSEAHAVYKAENVEKEDETPKTCGVTQTTWESDEPITVTAGQNIQLNTPKYIELLIVVDHAMYRKYTHNLTTIRTRVFGIVNNVNMIYRVFNIHVALIRLEIWSDRDKINVQSAANVTVELFGNWRETDLLANPNRHNDNAQLLTGIRFNGATIGIAYRGGLCHPNFSVGTVEDHNPNERLVSSTMAHELGHNLGMRHDTAACNCPATACIMTEGLGSDPTYHFSSCSYEDFERFITNQHPQCILNKPLITDIVAPPVCGNYFVEVGEECDCGPPQSCQSACCNATTCRLQPGTQCDAEECCEQCRFKGAGEVCRKAKDDCDLAENCTGQSAECPTDLFQENGKPCQNNQGYCYNGTCPILTNQCIADVEPDTMAAPDECFDNNIAGDIYGYCRQENGVYIPCDPKDVKCGRLFCTPRSGGIDICIYSNPPKEMVNPGTKCGDGMVCINRHCVDVKTAY